MDEISGETKQPQLSGRVHIIGLGNAGTFIAHSLASRQNPPPITLLMHHPSFYEAFRRKKHSLAINHNGLDDIKTGFDVEVFSNGEWWNTRKDQGNKVGGKLSVRDADGYTSASSEDDDHIECLIACSKANITEKALSTLSHRLTPDSTVCLVQNGMGLIDRLNETVFPDPENRPHYIQGVMSHGLVKKHDFQIAHNGLGSTMLTPAVTSKTPLIEAENDTHWPPTTKYLLRLMTLTPALIATTATPADILQHQLERLAVHCIINPLTALNDCKNGELLYIFSATRLMRLLLFEISSVICALPELQGVPGIEARFAPERLRRMVANAAALSANNTSSMLQDVRERRTSEIEYMNGWIVRRGEELGIKCVLNYMIKLLIYTKLDVVQRREASAVPIDFDNVTLTGDYGKDD